MAYDTVPMWDEVTLVGSGTGYTNTVELPLLGDGGVLVHAQVREDATLDEGSTATLIVAKVTPIDATTPDEDIAYESDPITLVGSATVASLIDNLYANGRATYKGKVYAALNITAATGGGASTSAEIRVQAMVTP